MERRACEGVSISLEGHARVAGRPGRVVATDLSINGCRINTSHGFVAVADAIILIFGDIRIIGRVAWCDGRNAGIQFRTQMHPALVEHLGFQNKPDLQEDGSPDGGRRSPAPFHSRSRVLIGSRDVVEFFSSPLA